MLLAAAIAAAVIAGCGGGNDSSAATSSQPESHTFTVEAGTDVEPGKLSKAQYVATANKLCKEGWVVIRGNFHKYSSWQSPKLSKPDLLKKVIQLSLLASIDFHLFDNMRHLGAPPGEEKQLEEVIGPMQVAVERGQRVEQIPTLPQVVKRFELYNQRAHQYGLDQCLVDTAHVKALTLGARS